MTVRYEMASRRRGKSEKRDRAMTHDEWNNDVENDRIANLTNEEAREEIKRITGKTDAELDAEKRENDAAIAQIIRDSEPGAGNA